MKIFPTLNILFLTLSVANAATNIATVVPVTPFAGDGSALTNIWALTGFRTNTVMVGTGDDSPWSSQSSVSIGYQAAVGDDAVAVGFGTLALTNAIAIGSQCDANGDRSIAIGQGAQVESDGTIAIGYLVSVVGTTNCIAIGNNIGCSKDNQTVIGNAGPSTTEIYLRGKIVGNGSGLTNLDLAIDTDSVSTGILPAGNLTITNLASNIKLAGFSGLDDNRFCKATLLCINNSGADKLVRIPPNTTMSDGGRAYWVTNKTTRQFEFGIVVHSFTNGATSTFW